MVQFAPNKLQTKSVVRQTVGTVKRFLRTVLEAACVADSVGAGRTHQITASFSTGLSAEPLPVTGIPNLQQFHFWLPRTRQHLEVSRDSTGEGGGREGQTVI